MSHVFDYLQGRGAVFTVIPHPDAETAAGAHALPFSEEEVVKTVVVMADFGPALMVVPVRIRPIARMNTFVREPAAKSCRSVTKSSGRRSTRLYPASGCSRDGSPESGTETERGVTSR
jgi:hypothetical protein